MADRKISQVYADNPANSFGVDQVFVDARSGANEGVTGQQIADSWGMDFLGSTKLLSGAHETSVVTLEWPPGSGIAATRDELWILVRVASYGGSPDPAGDIASLRFNGDSGNNYWSHHVYFSGGVWNSVPQANDSLIRLAETNSRLSRNVSVQVNNLATRGKTCNIKNQTGTANASLVGVPNVAGGEWVNLVDQITSVQMVDAGSNNMGTGSGFAVLGLNF